MTGRLLVFGAGEFDMTATAPKLSRRGETVVAETCSVMAALRPIT